MKLAELKEFLAADAGAWVRFRLPDGAWVEPHAHVSEVARVDKRFVDCGGTFRVESWCRMQAWVGEDTGHRLLASRLATALDKAGPVLGEGGDALDVDLEHGDGRVSQYPVEGIERGEGWVGLRLGERRTDCLAKERCVPSQPASVPIALGMKPGFRPGAAAGSGRTGLPLALVLCTGNSCRSHMAEGILRAATAGKLRVASAGSRPSGHVHPLAIRAMAEIGIDISGHESKHMDGFLRESVDTVITVCGNADQACPVFPGQVHRHHWPFDDPAHATGTDEEKMAVFRRVRDEIRRVFEAYAAGRCGG